MSLAVTTVCRHNQARSVMAAAVLHRYFPEMDISSAGVSAVEGQRIPQAILKLAELWDLEVLDVSSHSLEASADSLRASDFVVVAEDDFASAIVELGVEPRKVLSMQDKRFDHALIPFDPIGHGSQVVSVELAKAVMTTTQLIRAHVGLGYRNPVNAIFTVDEVDFESHLAQSWAQVQRNEGILIVADFRAPNFRAVSDMCDHVLEIQVGRVNQDITFSDGAGDGALERALESGRPFAISARHEVDQVERFAVSRPFIEMIAQLADSRPVVIVTEPLGMGPFPYLVAASGSL